MAVPVPVVIGSPIGLWVVASNSRNVPSSLPVAMMVPAGLNDSAVAEPAPVVIGLRDRSAGCRPIRPTTSRQAIRGWSTGASVQSSASSARSAAS